MRYSVLLADDHGLIRDGLRDAIRNDPMLSIVAGSANGIEAISAIKRFKPDCAVVDFQMPGANGLEVMREARTWSPDTRFVLLTAQAKPESLKACIEAGFGGVFFKTDSIDDLLSGLRRVCEGQTVISDEVALSLLQFDDVETLTRRERQVLHAIAGGMSNAAIADTLGISPKTVESHRTNLMRKLKVHSIASLLVRAFRDGLIDADQLDQSANGSAGLNRL